MLKTISVLLILVSSVASISSSFAGLLKPETVQVYNRTGISHLGIRLFSLFLGIGGLLLLFLPTFKLGGTILLIHSSITVICFILMRDWKGAAFEFVLLQLPIFILWAGYPISVLEKFKDFLTGTME